MEGTDLADLAHAFNLATTDEALDLCEKVLTLASHSLAQAKLLATAASQLHALKGKTIEGLQTYLTHVDGNLQIVAKLQSAVANTKLLRATLAAAPTGERIQ